MARRLVLTGRVQGVGFRYFTEERARVEGVHGWVRNRADGAVEVYLEGDRDAVSRVEARVRRGPPLSRVDTVDATDEVPTGRAGGFQILN